MFVFRIWSKLKVLPVRKFVNNGGGHLRSKIKKICNRKSRKAFRKRSRKSSSQRRTRENWVRRHSRTFSEQKTVAAWSRILDRLRSLATRVWSIFRLFWRHFFRRMRTVFSSFRSVSFPLGQAAPEASCCKVLSEARKQKPDRKSMTTFFYSWSKTPPPFICLRPIFSSTSS